MSYERTPEPSSRPGSRLNLSEWALNNRTLVLYFILVLAVGAQEGRGELFLLQHAVRFQHAETLVEADHLGQPGGGADEMLQAARQSV